METSQESMGTLRYLLNPVSVPNSSAAPAVTTVGSRRRTGGQHGRLARDVPDDHAAADEVALAGLLVDPRAAVDVVHDGRPGDRQALGFAVRAAASPPTRWPGLIVGCRGCRARRTRSTVPVAGLADGGRGRRLGRRVALPGRR